MSCEENLLKHPEDRLNFLRALTAVPILLLPLLTGLPDGWRGLVYGSVIWFLLNDVNFILHQHVHYPLTNLRAVNALLDFLMSCTTGMSAYNWRQHHVLRHHQGDDSWGKAYDWEFKRYSFLGAFTYSLRNIFVMYAYPLFEAIVNGLFKNKREPIDFRAALVEQVVVSAVVWWLIFSEPRFYATYFFLTYFFTGTTDYDNHVGCDESEYGFSNNTVNPAYNWIRNNFGYHTAHHYFPEAHWSRLPELHREIEPHIPGNRIQNVRWTGFLTFPVLLHLLAKLWRRTPSEQSMRLPRPS